MVTSRTMFDIGERLSLLSRTIARGCRARCLKEGACSAFSLLKGSLSAAYSRSIATQSLRTGLSHCSALSVPIPARASAAPSAVALRVTHVGPARIPYALGSWRPHEEAHQRTR